MNEQELINYYNKFNEDKRLKTKHGRVEYLTAMKYIHDYLKDFKNPKILDLGAGTGAYAIPLADEGYDVTAVELVKHNLKVIEKRSDKVNCILGNATNLSKFVDNTFDIVLVFGPMYHLITKSEKIKCLKEVDRVTKKDGIVLISYCMNEYALLTYGFKENHIKEVWNDKKVDKDFHIISDNHDLYSFVRLEDINELSTNTCLIRIKQVSQDGPTEYYKKVINKMDDETFQLFLEYHFNTCERPELLGSSRHVLDILKKS